MASTVKNVDTPAATDLFSGCRVILGGSTGGKQWQERVVTCNFGRIVHRLSHGGR